MIFESFKLVSAGLCSISLGGAGIGIGCLFGCYLISLSKNPSLKGELFSYLILGFALTEATALFSLLMAFLFLFAF